MLEMCVHSVPARNQGIGWPQIHSFIEGNTMKVLCVPLCCGFACVRKQHANCQTVISDTESDRSAIVRWFAGHALNHSAPLLGQLQTNNRAELQACIHALSVTPARVPLQLCVDSQLVTSGATLWMAGWIRRGWRTKQGTPVSNKDLWQQLAGR